jgi:predicted DNA-binding transcriptional regulator YafY
MRRADRLFQIVQLLRTKRLVTAGDIARELEVSPRTIYRDVADLIGSGVPIEGEAGVGYQLARGFDLPPLMFDGDEVGALVLGARMVKAFGDAQLARRAESALAKIEQVVPAKLRREFERPGLFVWQGLRREVRANVECLRRGIEERRVIRFAYRDEKGAQTERTVRPLCLAFWGTAWTAGTWCELRGAFRDFRPDRMEAGAELGAAYEPDPARDLAAYLAARRAEHECERRRASERD